ncbi:MAG: RHS repeat-associated core domain-containing protein [Gemmatimonadaceae bacterium]
MAHSTTGGGTGPFTQPDPIGLAGGLNLYGFAKGDPITFSDPFGLDCRDRSGRPVPCFPGLPIINAVATGVIMRMAPGTRELPLGSSPAGSSRSILGVTVNTRASTAFNAEITDHATTAIGFIGALEAEIAGQPDATFVRGALDLGSGQLELSGHLSILGPHLSSVSAVGNIQDGQVRVVVEVLGNEVHNEIYDFSDRVQRRQTDQQ